MRKELDVIFSCNEGMFLPDVDVWLVIDVLRATTMITRWFELGGRELYPVRTPNSAQELVRELQSEGSSPLLMGEVNGLRPEGFDVGNSPTELTYELVQSHYIGVMSTTNGTRALSESASTGRPVIAASFRNKIASLDHALTTGGRLGILCSGRKGRPSWEDVLCAGAIIEELLSREEVYLTDSAKIALEIWSKREANLLECVMKSIHAQYLSQIGFESDILFSLEQDVSTVVPVLYAEKGRNILRSVSGRGKPYMKPVRTEKPDDPFAELLKYARKESRE